MGDIYSAAQLTIIDAAGGHPAYGLPGVGLRARNFHLNHVSVGSSYVVALPLPGNLDIYISKWASRSWTFQEGYLSRRTLFFTDRQAIYICNREVGRNEPDFLYKPEVKLTHRYITDMLPRVDIRRDNGMTQAMAHLVVHTDRTLSYDSDALNAISGALSKVKDLSGSTIYHASGVPFAPSYLFPFVRVWIALHWRHPRCCRRRPGFPS
jgi:hypothetical protein